MDTLTATVKHAVAAALLALSLSVIACPGGGSPDTTPAPQGNLFVNPGLEDGPDPWFSLGETSSFVRTEERAHSGGASAHFRMRDPVEAEGAKVYYLVQEIEPPKFPEVVKGFYRVENWKKETDKQYLQFVVIAFEPENFPSTVSNWQIRYLLAGIDSPPFVIGNAHFVYVSREEPIQNEWIPFERNIREDFQRLWGRVPEDFEKIRILFEVRWDNKVAGEGAPEADVYYDDLYAGPAAAD